MDTVINRNDIGSVIFETTIAPEAHAGAKLEALAGEYLTFRVEAEEYGIDILAVKEIRSYEQPTRMAGAPPCVKGIINLRGEIVPVIDLRVRLGCDSTLNGPSTVVIVLGVQGRTIGAVVDSVSDVAAVQAGDIRPPPAFSAGIDSAHVLGLGCLDAAGSERMLILVNITALLDEAALNLLV